MASAIKVTLAADGEAKFKKAIANSEKSIKNLNTRLTLATAEFKRDGDAMALAQSKSETLTEEIDRQQEIVKALEGAVKDSSTAYGENSQQAERWEAQLNKAKTSLALMESELANNQKGLNAAGEAYEEAGNKAQQFGDAISDFFRNANSKDFLGLNQAIDNVTKRMENAVKKIGQLAKSAWSMVSESSTWADDLITLSTSLRVPLEELQGWQYAARFVDTEVSSIAKAMARLANPTKSVTEALKDYGISVVDASNQARSKEDIFWDIIETMGRMSDEAQQDALAQEVFGKSFSELIPLITAGRAEWEKYVQEAKDSGNVLSDDQVYALGDFNDSLQRVDSAMIALRNNIASEIAPAFKLLADSFGQLINDFNTWSQSEAGQKALQGLSDSIAAVVKSLTENVDFEALVGGATSILEKLGEALQGVANDPSGIINNVADALKVYAGLKIAQDVLSLLKIITSAGEMAGGAISSIGGIAGAAGKAVAAAGPVAAGALGVGTLAATVWAISSAVDDLAREREFGWTKELKNLSAGISPDGVAAIKVGIQAGISQGIEAANTAEEISKSIQTQWTEGMKLFESQLTEDSIGGKAFSQGELSILSNWIDNALGDDVKAATDKAHTMWQTVYDAAIGKGFTPEEATAEADSLLKDNPLIKTVNELEETKKALDDAMEQLYKAGNNATDAEIQKVKDLMSQVRDLQEQLGILQNDTARFAQDSYELTVQGKGTSMTMGAGITYVNDLATQRTEAAEKELIAAEQDRVKAMTEAQGNAEKEAAAMAEYTTRVEAANEALEQVPIDKAQMLANLVNGYSGNLDGTGKLEKTIDTITAITEAANALNSGGYIYKDEGYSDEYIDEVQNLINKGIIEDEIYAGEFLTMAMTDALETAMRDLDSQIPEMTQILDYVQAMVDETDIKDLDLSQLTGAFAAALKTQMIIEAAGADGILTQRELLDLLESDKWNEIGSAVPEGAAEGINNNADRPKIEIKQMDSDMMETMREDLEVNSPSKVARDIAAAIPEGAALGIEMKSPAAVAAALTAGQQISTAFAQGIESGISRVQSAINRMIAAASVSPSGGTWSGQAGTYTYTNSNRNNSLYIGTYNQNTSADVDNIISLIDDRRASVSAGYGA